MKYKKYRNLFSLILVSFLGMYLSAGCSNNDAPDFFDPSVYERMGYTVGRKPQGFATLGIFDEFRGRNGWQDSIVHVPVDGSTVELSIKAIANILLLSRAEKLHSFYYNYYHHSYTPTGGTCPDCIGISQKINEDIPYPWFIFQPVDITYNGMHVSHLTWDKLRINIDPDQRDCTDTTCIALGYGTLFDNYTNLTNPRSRTLGPAEFELIFETITLVRE